MDQSIELNGVKYVRKAEEQVKVVDGKEYSIVRTYSAGVFAGWIDVDHVGECGIVYDARRIWYWAGAASLSQLAVDGTSKPEECKFPCEVEQVKLSNIIEVIPCTEKAMKSIEEVPVWTA
jgi:hypothetical protein